MQFVEKMDDYGMQAWIALMVLAFIIFWPIGLAVLAYLIWSGRMGACRGWSDNWQNKKSRFRGAGGSARRRSSGNHAFDEYREETLRRLEEEQSEFNEFLTRLRMAKDKAEFDQFMSSRTAKSSDQTGDNGGQGFEPNPQT